MRRRSLLAATAIVLLAGVSVVLLAYPSDDGQDPSLASTPGSGAGHGAPLAAVRNPIDSRYLLKTPFGTSSFWIQPWRAYLDTWPASRLLDSLGINFDVKPAQARATARLLHESGFKLARIEVNWSSLSYEDPTRFENESALRTRLQALRENGLRPLILLDANSVAPAPFKRVQLQLAAPAPAGATSVRLTTASAAAVVAGRTGFDAVALRTGSAPGVKHKEPPLRSLTPEQRRARRERRRAERRAAKQAGLTALMREGNPALLIDRIDPGGLATLSRPLPTALAAGGYPASTLRYAPFQSPRLPGGATNPQFAATLKGWLGYVRSVTRLATGVFGPDGYDIEVWNELSFGSQFLNAQYYSSGQGAKGLGTVTKEVTQELLAATVRFVRGAGSGAGAGVGVSDGFADQTPFVSGGQAPVGLTALSKHLYQGAKQFPADYKERSIRPLDALGARDTQPGSFTPLFIPHFQSLFPEYYLTALSTETITRDLAPFTTSVYGDPHGRNVGPRGGVPPQKWMTEYNLSSKGATPMLPDQSTPASTTLTAADKRHFQAKALLRSLVAMVNKGMTREYFFAATGGQLGMIDPAFFTALENHPGTYPGQAAGGETMRAFKNMLSQFQGPGPGTSLKRLKLTSITQDGEHAQFAGDGTPQHPSLYDREVLAVLPFQSSPSKYVIPVYVMTRDLLTLYKPDAPATDTTRFDLPGETFQITLQNLPDTKPATTLYDPIANQVIPAHITNQTSTTTTIEIQATDYPRILTLNYGKSG